MCIQRIQTILLYPLLKKILPDIKEDHETLGYVAGNIIANIFGFKEAKMFEINDEEKLNSYIEFEKLGSVVTKVYVNGSVVGTEQYAFSKRLFTEPS